ncbi:MAG: hypothetical protein ABSG05_02320 [Candidatus Pacearchaeota archaeon]|jgi:hypothetical protein
MKKIELKNKKGELTTQEIVILIVLIISFVIILFLLLRLNLGGTTNEEICHNSVVLNGQSSLASGPLNCKTDYLCISGGSSNCINFFSSNKISVVQNNKTQVMKVLADKMSTCWSEFGEGQIDYASGSVFGNKLCALCSIVNFDSSLKNSQISYKDFYTYLQTTKKTDTQTYLQYLYSTNNLDDFNSFYLTNYLSNSIDTSKEYFILTGISKKSVWGLFGKANQIPVTIMEKTPENYNTIGCDQFITKA